jgi:hypothetical protein
MQGLAPPDSVVLVDLSSKRDKRQRYYRGIGPLLLLAGKTLCLQHGGVQSASKEIPLAGEKCHQAVQR